MQSLLSLVVRRKVRSSPALSVLVGLGEEGGRRDAVRKEGPAAMQVLPHGHSLPHIPWLWSHCLGLLLLLVTR